MCSKKIEKKELLINPLIRLLYKAPERQQRTFSAMATTTGLTDIVRLLGITDKAVLANAFSEEHEVRELTSEEDAEIAHRLLLLQGNVVRVDGANALWLDVMERRFQAIAMERSVEQMSDATMARNLATAFQYEKEEEERRLEQIASDKAFAEACAVSERLEAEERRKAVEEASVAMARRLEAEEMARNRPTTVKVYPATQTVCVAPQQMDVDTAICMAQAKQYAFSMALLGVRL